MKALVISSDRTSGSGNPINLGDAMLTDALTTALEARGVEAIAADFGGERRGVGAQRLRLGGVQSLARAIREFDIVIVGGGTLLQDDAQDTFSGWGGLPRLCAVTSVLARLSRTPIAYFAVGCDPVGRFGARTLLRTAVRGIPVWVRDEKSFARVKDTLHGSPLLAADAALLLGRQERALPASDAPIVVALNGKHARDLRPEHVERLRADGHPVVFLNMSQGDGFVDSDALPDDTRRAFDQVTAELDWPSALKIISDATSVYASRMHALYASMLRGVPMVAVSELPKVTNFANDFAIGRVDSARELASIAPTTARPDALDAAIARVGSALDDLLTELS